MTAGPILLKRFWFSPQQQRRTAKPELESANHLISGRPKHACSKSLRHVCKGLTRQDHNSPEQAGSFYPSPSGRASTSHSPQQFSILLENLSSSSKRLEQTASFFAAAIDYYVRLGIACRAVCRFSVRQIRQFCFLFFIAAGNRSRKMLPEQDSQLEKDAFSMHLSRMERILVAYAYCGHIATYRPTENYIEQSR